MSLARLLLAAAVFVVGAGKALAYEQPSYTKHVRPFLDRYCVECHRTGKVKGRVNLEDYQAMMKSSRKGRMAVVAGKADQSTLVLTCEGKRPVMPPRKSKQPKAEEIALVRAWVNAGAEDDTPVKKPKPPENTNPAEPTSHPSLVSVPPPLDLAMRETINPAAAKR
jgi:hypothetical protein